MILESLGWIAFFCLLAFIIFRSMTYNSASEFAHKQAAELGMVRMSKDTLWVSVFVIREFGWVSIDQSAGLGMDRCQGTPTGLEL